MADLNYIIKKQNYKELLMRTVVSSSYKRKSRATTEFEIRKQKNKVEFIDEINRQNLNGDYGV